MQLSIRAKGLRDKDVLSKSDPMAVVSHFLDGKWIELGRTEVVANTTSPQFVARVRMDYMFETLQTIKIDFYDIDSKFDGKPSKDLPLELQDYLGFSDFILSEVITQPSKQLSKPIQNPQSRHKKGKGIATLMVEEVANTNADVLLELKAEGLSNLDAVGKSDPFVRISRLTESGALFPVYKTEVKKNTLAPVWRPLTVTMQQLCNGDVERPLVLEVYDWDRRGTHELIGLTQRSLRDMQDSVLAVGGGGFSLFKTEPGAASGIQPVNVKPSGTLHVSKCDIIPRHSFLDYIFGGCEINFLVAVDFTASNGDPQEPGTLHYIDPRGTPNIYQEAIKSVGEVVQYYDTDKRFPAWGFGGKYMDNPVSHCFSLNGDANHPEVVGVQGILAAYKAALDVMTLSGPTLFSPVVTLASQIASQAVSQHSQKYFCLLIITDGAIMDLPKTIEALVEASSLPLSVIIIGVGSSDFASMQVLDADKAKLSHNGKTAARDCVQFVAFEDFARKGAHGHRFDLLAKHVLAELPSQFLEFMSMKGIHPNQQQEPERPSAQPRFAMPNAPPLPSTVGGIPTRSASAMQQPRYAPAGPDRSSSSRQPSSRI
eukprot:jgi/Mesvir1/22570/Mv18574-RA.1